MSEKTEKLSKILKDVEGGYISADHAEANILYLFESDTLSPAMQDVSMIELEGKPYEILTQTVKEGFSKERTSLNSPLQEAVKGFSRAEIEQLQNKVHEITGNGDVMVLFNQLLGNSTA